ncbi:hypothetical protein [Caballeronia sp. AZ1_KS37]|uniref:hypothetical protein n=1 Tax=Caballeronia sp. AZ1_KS37 TaxID=2921756 RepID=UPI0020287E67|nr:hypothetical protein [Caballeronia sp. AZ1_KS37]
MFIDKIAPGLDQIERPGDFSNEHVFEALAHGHAFLFVLTIDGEYNGFTVLQEVNEFNNKRLHIWLTFSDTHQDVLTVFNDDIERCAQAMGATSISFSSSRPAWQKVAPRHGFVPRETVYSRPVNNPKENQK